MIIIFIHRFSVNHYEPLRESPNFDQFLHAARNLSAEVFRRLMDVRESTAAARSLVQMRLQNRSEMRVTCSQAKNVICLADEVCVKQFFDDCVEADKPAGSKDENDAVNQFDFGDPALYKQSYEESSPSKTPNSVEDGKYLSGMSFYTNNICIQLRDFERCRRSGLDKTER